MFGLRRKYYRERTDEELIALYKTEQHSLCFSTLYERYAHLVIGVAMKYLKNVQEAEDLTMNLFEKLPAKLIEHDIKHFRSWLYMVTKNDCFMLLRKQGRYFTEEPGAHLTTEEDQNTEQKELQLEALEEVLPLLKDEQRVCIELFYLKEMSYQQISDELKISMMQVKSAIQNGKRNLKLRLEERNEFNTNE